MATVRVERCPNCQHLIGEGMLYEHQQRHCSKRTNPRPPAPADPWQDVRRFKVTTWDGSDADRVVFERQVVDAAQGRWMLASEVDAARLATEQQHQQEKGRIEALAESYLMELRELEQHTARLRAALRDAARETAKLAATFDTNTDETKATDANV